MGAGFAGVDDPTSGCCCPREIDQEVFDFAPIREFDALFNPQEMSRPLSCVGQWVSSNFPPLVILRRDQQQPASTFMVESVRYGQCERNHAAIIGGYAVDGCREFMACNGEEGSAAALTCATCGCHRSYHIRNLVASTSTNQAPS